MDHKIVFQYISDLLTGAVTSKTFKPIDIGINPVEFLSSRNKKFETLVVSCAFAGTNWVTRLNTVRESSNQTEIEVIKEVKKVIPVNARKCTFDSFINLMANQIQEVVIQTQNIESINIGISLGFAHENFSNKFGLDAKIDPVRLTKSWEITDSNSISDFSIGGNLNKKLIKSGLEINKLVVLNDTNSILLDNIRNSEIIPASFVFGTGVNAALKNQNLEIGQINLSPDIFGHDEIYDKAYTKGYFEDEIPTLEQFIGGNYLKIRVAMQLDKDEDTILSTPQPDILNQILIKKVKLKSDLEFASQVVRHEYEHAGKLAGSLIAAVVSNSGFNKPYGQVNVEGSVFWKNNLLRETAIKTVQELIPHIDIDYKPASGLNGIALLASVY